MASPRSASTSPTGPAGISALGLLLLLAWLAGAVLLTRLLWPQWQENAELSHGFAAPLLFVILLAEARSADRTHLPGNRAVTHAVGEGRRARAQGWLARLLSLAACASLLVAGLYAAAFGWAWWAGRR